MAISIDVRRYAAMKKKKDKLMLRVKSVEVEMASLRSIYSAVSNAVLSEFDKQYAHYCDKQAIKQAEGA
jgi:hypothetical protein